MKVVFLNCVKNVTKKKKKKKKYGRKIKFQNMLFVSLSLLKFLSTFQNTPC